MAEHVIDQSDWPRAAQYRLFRGYDRPHYAITVRIDTSHLRARRGHIGLSPYRACLFAIGAGLHAEPALCTRFRGDTVIRHDAISLSMTVPREDGSYGYAYLPFTPDPAAFDAEARAIIDATAAGRDLGANTGQRDDVAYLSCLPWLDYTSLDTALPGPHDCIPRISWGRMIDHGIHSDMAMTAQVHHALVDGAHLGRFFETVQSTLNAL